MCLDSEGECIEEMISIAADVLEALIEMAIECPEAVPATIMEVAAKVAPDLLIPLCPNVNSSKFFNNNL